MADEGPNDVRAEEIDVTGVDLVRLITHYQKAVSELNAKEIGS